LWEKTRRGKEKDSKTKLGGGKVTETKRFENVHEGRTIKEERSAQEGKKKRREKERRQIIRFYKQGGKKILHKKN